MPDYDSTNLDDTQGHKPVTVPDSTPFDDRPITSAREIIPDDDDEIRPFVREGAPRGGCGLTGIILVMLGIFSVIIVALAGAAGWTTGGRQAAVNSTATQNAAIAEQVGRIPTDLADGNLVLLEARIQFLATLTPGVAGMNDVMATATSLYMTLQPTATATPTSTATPTATATATATLDPNLPSPTPGPNYDLAALLSEAQGEFVAGNYEEAAALAEAITSIDPGFETGTVRGLLTDSLNTVARNYYNAMQPAAGNQIVGRIQSLGLPLAEGLAYERDVGEIYLNAISTIGISYPQAINALQQLIGYGQGRYYNEAVNLLYRQYIAYGDALAFDPAFGQCAAAQQYRSAFSLTGGGEAGGKLTTADALCASATPTPDPLLAGTPGVPPPAGVAPIGQPGG
ncbi:MAG: hypothetical protein KME04_08310 [Pleurocapsa minor GSE-CHR-MK-17-07R]|jgi:hypothetical protein|nr:hypothetical protein [Pleurocapsa minor GSE-CHR-MK 17-07R]